MPNAAMGLPGNGQPSQLRLWDGTPIPHQSGVYLLHAIDQNGKTARYWHAGHYTGYAEDLPTRIAVELAGGPAAANLCQVMLRAGLRLQPTWVGPGLTRGDERSMKGRGAAQYCPRCRAERPTNRGRLTRAELAKLTSGLAPGLSERAAVFLQLNPSFARPVRAPRPVQWERVRDREYTESLGLRVRAFEGAENDRLSQDRVRAVIRLGRSAVTMNQQPGTRRRIARARPQPSIIAARADVIRADAIDL